MIALIGIEILLSLIGLWAGYKRGKVLDQQTIALIHMDASTSAMPPRFKRSSPLKMRR